MANNLEKATLFQDKLDKQMLQVSTTGFMEANQNMVKYNGGNSIKIAKILIDGLKDYDRSAGFGSAGAVDLSFSTYTFDKDRGQTFNLDAMEVDESNFIPMAGTVMAEFQRTQVVPEVDAYRFSKIYSEALAGSKVGQYTPAEATVFEQLGADIASVQDVIGEQEELVVAMSFGFANILDNADKVVKNLTMSDFTSGSVSNKVRTLDGIPLLRVPSARLKTAYNFTTGFAPVDGALDINYIIMAKSSIIAITKTDKPRIWNPDQNINADAYKIDYRKYHTLFIPDNKLEGIYVSRKPATSVSSSAMTLLTANNTVTITLADGEFADGVSISDLSFTGTDATALAAGSVVRTSDTVVTLTIATGNTGTNNIITVTGSALELQATSVTAVASTV